MQREKKYFTTGEFARFFGIRKDTLFYYDKIGLFRPEAVGENGYRHYSDAQIATFSALLSFRELGVSVKELQDYFHAPSPERLLRMASAKIEEIEREMQRLREIRQLFSDIAAHTREAREAELGRVQILKCPDAWFLYSEQLSLDAETATGEQWGDAYDRFTKQTGAAGAVPVGSVVARRNLRRGDFGKVDRLFMPCAPGRGECRPGGMYAVFYYQGPFETMSEGYKKLMEEIRKRGFEPAGDAYEEYLVAELATKNEKDYVTKISVEIK